MRQASAARLVRLGPAAILALTALVVSRPAEVQAGCGLYVSHAASGEAFLHELSPSILGDVGAAERSERPRPCSGPSCSEAPQTPPLAPTVSAPRPAESWACLAGEPVTAISGSSLLVVPNSPLRSVEIARRIFHPPRRLFAPSPLCA